MSAQPASSEPSSGELFTLFGWLALIDALALINEKDPTLAHDDLDATAITHYVARRRDALLQHNCPRFSPAR